MDITEYYNLILSGFAACVVTLLINHLAKSDVPKLYYSKTNPHARSIIEQCSSINSAGGFRKTFWLFNGHLQTIGAAFLRSNAKGINYRRENLDLPDGGIIALDWVDPKENKELSGTSSGTNVTIILLHGLTGGSHETYIRHFIMEAQKHNWRCVVFNFRGAADSILKTPLGYCAAYTDDLRIVLKHVSSKLNKNGKLFAMGFSLGANILVKYLGEEGDKTPIQAAISVSNPFNLLKGASHLEKPLYRNLYSKTLANNVKRYAKRHYDILKTATKADIDETLSKTITLRDFDELATRRMFGYNSVDEYYEKASSYHFIKDVKVPLLALTALDDPIVPPECIPYKEAEESDNLILAVTSSGGHVAWVQDWNLRSSYMDVVCSEYFSAMIQHLK